MHDPRRKHKKNRLVREYNLYLPDVLSSNRIRMDISGHLQPCINAVASSQKLQAAHRRVVADLFRKDGAFIDPSLVGFT